MFSIQKIDDGVTLSPPSGNELCSESAFLFAKDLMKSVDYFYFSIINAHHIDEIKEIARKALGDDKPAVSEKKLADRVADFSYLNQKTLTLSACDSYLWFIIASIRAAIERRPELLRTGEKLTYEEALEFEKRSEIIKYILEKKIHDLSMSGIYQINQYVDKHFGLSLFPDEECENHVRLLIQFRNAFSHNRGYVNRVIAEKSPKIVGFPIEQGKRVHVTYDRFSYLAYHAARSAAYFDEMICRKYRIRRLRFSTWRARQRKPSRWTSQNSKDSGG